MNVSPDALRKETVKTLKDIQEVIDEQDADVVDIPPMVIAPLLLAKAQCLNTLVLLNEKR